MFALLPLAWLVRCSLSSSVLQYVLDFCSFSRLNNIPLCSYTTFHLFNSWTFWSSLPLANKTSTAMSMDICQSTLSKSKTYISGEKKSLLYQPLFLPLYKGVETTPVIHRDSYYYQVNWEGKKKKERERRIHHHRSGEMSENIYCLRAGES